MSEVLVQLLVPAIVAAVVAAVSSYVAVSMRLTKVETRQEERFEGLGRELRLRDKFVEHKFAELQKTDERLEHEIDAVKARAT